MIRSNKPGSEEGTVSVYLILLIVPIFLFHAIFIDYARIKLTEKESESAIKAGVRSTLSAFDNELRPYGLFGLKLEEEEQKELFQGIVEANLQTETGTGGYRFIDPRVDPEKTGLRSMYTLADQVVFKRQVLEEMKYRAPVEYALGVTDAFRKTGIDNDLRHASEVVKLSEKAEELLELRNSEMEKAWDEVTGWKRQTEEWHKRYLDKLQELNELAEQIGLRTLDEVKQEISEVDRQLEVLRQNASDLSRSIRDLNQSMAGLAMAGAEAAGAIRQIWEQRARIEQTLEDVQTRINEAATDRKILQDLLERIARYTALSLEIKSEVQSDDGQVQEYETRIKEHLDEAKQRNRDLREELGSGRSEEGTGGNSLPVERLLSGLDLPDDYFDRYQTSMASAAAAFHGFRRQLESTSMFREAPFARLLEDNDRYKQLLLKFFDEFSSSEEKRMADNTRVQKQKSEQKKNLQSVLNEAGSQLFGCRSGAGSSAYERLQGNGDVPGLYAKYMNYNDLAAPVEQDPQLGDAAHAGKISFDLIDRLLAALQTARDELYVDEYALTKFNFRTIGAGSEGQAPAEAGLDDHALKAQEVEYVLYGKYSCEANYASAYAEMFGIRLAVRTLEAMTEPRSKVMQAASPGLALLTILAEAAGKAYEDMKQLLAGESVPLINKLGDRVKLGYKDYLRLFLLIHSDDAKTMARMQALIELNTGRDLTRLTTYLQGTVTTSVRLWFLPQAMRMLHGIGALDCEVSENRCSTVHTAALAYE